MTIKIIHGKSQSIKETIDYVLDERKTAKDFNEILSEYDHLPDMAENETYEEFCVYCEDHINRALNYISNEDKIGGFISGYLCDPEFAEEQFRLTKILNLRRVGKQLKDDKGNYFYHIIQSFPEDIRISDTEVHQCGFELVKRLGIYQAVVTSHIHPVINEEGKVSGKCKHNHIILNSHIYHELVDPSNPNKMKYHDCKESYAQLQLINDQIAIEHGLPIIMNPDNERTHSWYETEQKNKGKSWKERVRIDINNAMRTSTDFSSFVESMNAAGYKLRVGNSKTNGEYITYTCPDNSHTVRDYVLGREYTKTQIEAYWTLKKNIAEEMLYNRDYANNSLEQIISSTSSQLYIKFENKISYQRNEKRREQNLNLKKSYTNYFPLNSNKRTFSKAELTYFDALQTYQIVNEQHRVIAEVNGDDILAYFNQQYEQRRRQAEEERRRRKEEQQEYYSNLNFISSATKTPYKIRKWDQNGRKRTVLELIIILAVLTIQKEHGKWETSSNSSIQSQELKRRPIYAKKDWKVQNMLDTIKAAREENIESLNELEKRLDIAGKDVTKAKAELRRLTATKNRMDTLYDAIEGYKEVKEICEQIQVMPDGEEKIKLQQQHANEIEDYKYYKSVMYRHKATTDEEIQDFYERYQMLQEKLPKVEKEVEKFSEKYRKLSKLKYNLDLAQNRQYCYGPEYLEKEQQHSKHEEREM